MRVPQQTRNNEPLVDKYEYSDHQLIVADFGPNTSTATDIVDNTVIIVTETDQHELELPENMTDATASEHNGIVTIQVNS